MTRRQTRMFFVVGTRTVPAIFITLTIDSHTKFAELTHEEAITPSVVEGKHVWHRKNCINCHTLLGEGAYFAPDLTKITQIGARPYLRQFLKDPSRFYSEEQHGRLMPNPNLSDQEIADVIAFLTWVSNIDNHNWPPRPIVVSAATPRESCSAPLCLRPPRAIRSRSVRRCSARRRPHVSAAIHCSRACSLSDRRSRDRARAPRRPEQRRSTQARHRIARGLPPRIHPAAERLHRPGPDVLGRRPVDHARVYQTTMLKPEEIEHLVAYLATIK